MNKCIAISNSNNISYHHFFSNHTNIQTTKHNDHIHLCTQFFIHPNKKRHKEIQETLSKNVHNKHIHTIHLLNERIYTTQELGIKSDKIKQIVIHKILHFSDFFNHAQSIHGYLILANADIFFDHTLENLYHSGIHSNKICYNQLRFENNELYGGGVHTETARGFETQRQKNLNWNLSFLKKEDILMATCYSSDSWIFHSNFFTIPNNIDFPLGQIGCDNRFPYEMYLAGFEIISEPFFIQTHHNHTSNIRNYNIHDDLKGNYLCIVPNLKPYISSNKSQIASFTSL